MLSPDKVIFAPPTLDTTACEADFDKAITLASTSGIWPARVVNARDGLTPEQIDATILKYRDAGWHVLGYTQGVRAVIYHPQSPETIKARLEAKPQ